MKSKMNIALGVVQVLLAGLFIFAGVAKLMMPTNQLAQIPLPAAFIYFISVCEIVGGLGLVLPGLFKVKTHLTPIAAAGLTIIMIGAVILSVVTMGAAMAILPLVVGVLCAFVAYQRWQGFTN